MTPWCRASTADFLLAVRVRERKRREGGLERTIEDDSNLSGGLTVPPARKMILAVDLNGENQPVMLPAIQLLARIAAAKLR